MDNVSSLSGVRSRRWAKSVVVVGTCLVVGVATLLTGCGGSKKVKSKHQAEVDYAELLTWLPGKYDNTEQVAEDIKAGLHPPHDDVALNVLGIDVPRIGKDQTIVYYVKETVAHDPLRVTGQKLLVFTMEDKTNIVSESIYSFNDPMRWRDGDQDPVLFSAITFEDLGAKPDCVLVWTKQEDRYEGQSDPIACHGPSRGVVGAVRGDYRAELYSDELSVAERAYNSRGELVHGRNDEPFLKFKKQSGQ